jgi:hypothetical protein
MEFKPHQIKYTLKVIQLCSLFEHDSQFINSSLQFTAHNATGNPACPLSHDTPRATGNQKSWSLTSRWVSLKVSFLFVSTSELCLCTSTTKIRKIDSETKKAKLDQTITLIWSSLLSIWSSTELTSKLHQDVRNWLKLQVAFFLQINAKQNWWK